jgi:cell wall-associated NlpC family hydrolase
VSYGREHRLPLSAKRVSLVSAAALLGTLVLSASPGAADPDKSNGASSGDKPSISEVKERLDTLNHQAEIASENLNTVRVQVQEARQRLSALQADVERKRSRVEALREQVVGSALADFQNGGGLSTTTSFLVADDPGTFMNGVASKAMVEHQQTGLLSKLTQQQRQLGAQEKQAQSAVTAINEDRADIAAHKQELTDRTQQAQDLLDSLEAAERARLLRLQAAAEPTYTEQPSRSVPRPPTSSVPASGRAEVAVQTALAQIGDPYVYGAAGPDAFDCSGLTMYAWNAAGVALSHSSSVQSTQGTPVSVSALVPGDLVFYYSPVSHVGMYIGGGNIVHAPHTGTTVQIASLYSMPINHAMHIG